MPGLLVFVLFCFMGGTGDWTQPSKHTKRMRKPWSLQIIFLYLFAYPPPHQCWGLKPAPCVSTVTPSTKDFHLYKGSSLSQKQEGVRSRPALAIWDFVSKTKINKQQAHGTAGWGRIGQNHKPTHPSLCHPQLPLRSDQTAFPASLLG